MKNRHLLIALVLVIVVNVVILLGVAGNRSGQPEATLTLTERELGYTPSNREENSGVSLRLDTNNYAGSGSWFDEQKLADLGFDVAAIKQRENTQDRAKEVLPKRGYVVLEYAGEAWRSYQAEQEAKMAELRGQMPADDKQKKQHHGQIAQIKRNQQSSSRLFAVDAGPDPELLRQAYPGRNRFVIVVAELGLGYGSAKEPHLKGRINQLLITSLHVPRDLQGQLVGLPPRKYVSPYLEPEKIDDWQPRYEVVVSWGSRFEPWIEAITLTPAGKLDREVAH